MSFFVFLFDFLVSMISIWSTSSQAFRLRNQLINLVAITSAVHIDGALLTSSFVATASDVMFLLRLFQFGIAVSWDGSVRNSPMRWSRS